MHKEHAQTDDQTQCKFLMEEELAHAGHFASLQSACEAVVPMCYDLHKRMQGG